MYNPTIDRGAAQNGRVVADGKGFVDPFQILDGLKTGWPSAQP